MEAFFSATAGWSASTTLTPSCISSLALRCCACRRTRSRQLAWHKEFGATSTWRPCRVPQQLRPWKTTSVPNRSSSRRCESDHGLVTGQFIRESWYAERSRRHVGRMIRALEGHGEFGGQVDPPLQLLSRKVRHTVFSRREQDSLMTHHCGP